MGDSGVMSSLLSVDQAETSVRRGMEEECRGRQSEENR